MILFEQYQAEYPALISVLEDLFRDLSDHIEALSRRVATLESQVSNLSDQINHSRM